jgi:hypothetical protein
MYVVPALVAFTRQSDVLVAAAALCRGPQDALAHAVLVVAAVRHDARQAAHPPLVADFVEPLVADAWAPLLLGHSRFCYVGGRKQTGRLACP